MRVKNEYLQNFQMLFRKIFSSKMPIIDKNTFLLWEPCSQSHAEVIPGYAKYLLDLGYSVSVLITPQRYKEGLFSRFNQPNLFFNKLSQKQIKKYLKKTDLSDVQGILVTTVGKLCDEVNFEKAYDTFSENADKSKIFFVSHEAKPAIEANSWKENLITLRELNYKDAKSVVVNPHYFGNVHITPKNEITNFITVGAIRSKRKNNNQIIDMVMELHQRGVRNFKVTVIGKGHLKHLPKEIRPYFDIKGRLNFDKMYDEIEKADFMLTSYNENNPLHQRYNTTGTSGNFQLVYGFLKPCIIIESFARINGFDNSNAIIYKQDSEYADAMIKAIEMPKEEYSLLQKNLQRYVDYLYGYSKENLSRLIND